MEQKKPPAQTSKTIEALYLEERRFEPPASFRERAVVSDDSLYKKAEKDIEGFWAEQAETVHWFRKWDRVRQWEPPWVKWFLGGKLNLSYNCIDRHVESPRRNKAALIWEGEPGDERVPSSKGACVTLRRYSRVIAGNTFLHCDLAGCERWRPSGTTSFLRQVLPFSGLDFAAKLTFRLVQFSQHLSWKFHITLSLGLIYNAGLVISC